jgi:hypothetical protein
LACTFIVFAGALGGFRAAAAQTIVEVGGGSTYRKDLPPNDGYTLGFNARVSVGKRLSDHTMLRLDAFVSQHDSKDSTEIFPPCAFPGCHPLWNINRLTDGVAGLMLNGIVELDPRGIVYLVGAAGVDEAYGRTSTAYSETHLAGSFGAGFTVPIGPRLRAVLEAQLHGVFGQTRGTPWFVPITVGLRY